MVVSAAIAALCSTMPTRLTTHAGGATVAREGRRTIVSLHAAVIVGARPVNPSRVSLSIVSLLSPDGYVYDARSLRSPFPPGLLDRKSTRLNSSHLGISYAVFC